MNSDEFIVPRCDEQIDILFQDQHLLVINKPSGLLSLSGKNPLNIDSVHYRLVQQYPSATMAHRLDFGTSGVMVLALNKEVNAHLTKQFQSRSVIKRYVAILYGDMANDEGVIEAPIAKGQFPRQEICFERGKSSQSYYRVMARLCDESTGIKMSRVLFSPTTGRTHQLRIHSREIGHPIIGCDLYGLKIDGVDTTKLSNRLCLHASYLEFIHPINDVALSFHSSCDFFEQ